ALWTALAPLALETLGLLATPRTVSARAFPPERLHRHPPERQQIVGKPRALHRDERLGFVSLRDPSVARERDHPALGSGGGPSSSWHFDTLQGAEPERTVGRLTAAGGPTPGRQAEVGAAGHDDQPLA